MAVWYKLPDGESPFQWEHAAEGTDQIQAGYSQPG